jgi:hypothetical protein
MKSYRFARRSFIAAVGGAFGLRILLRNLEGMAQGMTSPPRFLMTHWPVGTIRYHFLPTGSGADFTFSRILKPFEPLKSDTIILYGLKDALTCPGGGGHESGTTFTTTGASAQGTRSNGGESDDGTAGGPSFDQIFLKKVPALQRPGIGYFNSICDARVDSFETSTQCLSYDYATRSIASAVPGGNITEHIPLLPELSPTQAFMKLFSGFMPGGSTPANMDALAKSLKARKSVLDYSLSELDALSKLAPGSERPKIDAHTAAIRKIEQQITDQIANPSSVGGGAGCMEPMAPDPKLVGKTGSHSDYANPVTTIADDVTHEQIGKLHAGIILAAFQCDIIRVATFQWSPGTNHVSFKGLMPGEPNTIYMHHPQSHKIGSASVANGPPPTDSNAGTYDFLASVHTWYNQKTADILTSFKTAVDGFGNSILDYTIIPYVTEVAETSHSRSPKPSLIFGGKKLGMQGGQFLNFSTLRPQVDVFLTIAQAYFGDTNPLSHLTGEVFSQSGASPIAGLWQKPA